MYDLEDGFHGFLCYLLCLLIFVFGGMLGLRYWKKFEIHQNWKKIQTILETEEGYLHNRVDFNLGVQDRGKSLYLLGSVTNSGDRSIQEMFVEIHLNSSYGIENYEPKLLLLGSFNPGETKSIHENIYQLQKPLLPRQRVIANTYPLRLIFKKEKSDK